MPARVRIFGKHHLDRDPYGADFLAAGALLLRVFLKPGRLSIVLS
jgi:hypothetical protein